jgi:acetyl-CoA C-acetyltransferase
MGLSAVILTVTRRAYLTTLKATINAATATYKMVDIAPSDINTVEVYDYFTINEVILSEDLGFFKKGKV